MGAVRAPLSPSTGTSPQMPQRTRNLGGDVIVVEDRLDGQCVRHVHLMSNTMIADDALGMYGVPQGDDMERGKWEVGLEVGVWHYRAVYPYRGMIDIPAACKEGKVRRLVVWNLEGCLSVTVALYDAAHEYERLFGGRAEFGFMKKLPKAAEHGMELGDLILLEADWMLERCVAVGGKAPASIMQIPVEDAVELTRQMMED